MSSLVNNLVIKKENIRNNKLIELFFIIGILLYTFKTLCNDSLLINIEGLPSTIIYGLSIICIMPKVLVNKYSKKELLFSLSLISLTVFCILFSNTKNLILIPLILIGLKDSNIKLIVKYILYLTVIILLIHFVNYLYMCIIEGKELTAIFRIEKEVYRPTMSFESHNTFCSFVACSLLQYTYITDRNKKRYLKGLIILLISLFVYLLGQSYASLAISIFISLFYFLEESKRACVFINKIKNVILIICVGFSLLMPLIDDNNKIGFLFHHYLNGRIKITTDAIKLLGISVFPQVDKYDNLLTMPMDNLYVGFILKWGIIVTICIGILYVVLSKPCIKHTIINYYLCLMFMWGVVENIPKLITITIVPLILINYFYKNLG